jgi:hypothetical protein
MAVADRDKKAEDAAKLAKLVDNESKKQRDLDDKKRAADEEIRKKLQEDERVAKAIADAKVFPSPHHFIFHVIASRR